MSLSESYARNICSIISNAVRPTTSWRFFGAETEMEANIDRPSSDRLPSSISIQRISAKSSWQSGRFARGDGEKKSGWRANRVGAMRRPCLCLSRTQMDALTRRRGFMTSILCLRSCTTISCCVGSCESVLRECEFWTTIMRNKIIGKESNHNAIHSASIK